MSRDPMRWVWRGVTGATLLFGWIFILWQNKFHVDVPVVVVCLGYLAVVLTITNLWRVGAAAVAPEDATDEAWSRPLGERGELEKEKKTLLKAIKEAEFDQAMGKLSKVDAEELIRMYRARAIEVIKELERIDAGGPETPRQKIEREVAARLAVEQKAKAEAKAAQQKKQKVETAVEKVETAADKVELTDDKVKAATETIETAADRVETPKADDSDAAKEASS